MKENSENTPGARRRSPDRKPFVIAAAILAFMQACLTIEGRGIEGFILWVIILFVGYLLLFILLVWLWGKLRDRAS